MSSGNADQQVFWTDLAGPTWVAQMDGMDTKLAPLLEGVLARADLQSGEHVLDIGCGAGTSTIAAATHVQDTGSVLGVDISATLLEVATARASGLASASFSVSDAQTHRFQPESFDCLISRLGVMFFEDPLSAFVNMTNALRPGGRMAFATWGAIPENPYFTMPARVSKSVLGSVPRTDPDAPGPFAFREPARVLSILENAGLKDLNVQETALELTPGGDAQAVAELMCEIGPAQRALQHFEAGAQARAELSTSIAEGLAPYQTANGIRIPALINFFTASKPA